MRYLFTDVETGGLDPSKTSLLTASFLAVDPDQSEFGSLDLMLRPNGNEAIIATEKALQVNGIDLTRHVESAATYTHGRSALCEFLDICRPALGGISSFIPVGFNVSFDLSFLWYHLLPRSTWEQYVSYAAEDLKGTARFIHRARGIAIGHSLDAVVAHYGLSRPPGPHTSHADVRLTRDLFFRLQEAVR